MEAIILRTLALVALAFAYPAAAADGDVSPALPPAEEAAAITAAEARGRAIYEHDRAAAIATDVALAHPGMRDDRRVRGWITEQQANGITVTFIDQTPAALYRVAVATTGDAGPLVAHEAPEPLSVYEAGAAAARSAALQAQYQPCADRYNSVVIPAAAAGDWLVYLLPGTTRNDVVPLGGTYRVEVRDGALVSQRPFTRSCIALEPGSGAGAMMITHLMDPVPTEVHVHWSLWADTPMYVATPLDGEVWAIEHGMIRKLGRAGEDP